MGTTLDLSELGERVLDVQQWVFRLETLPLYSVDADGEDYHRWRAGATEPTWERKQPWLDFLRDEAAAGKVRSRVRIFSEQLSDYERYASQFGYALNVSAGEQVRVLRRGEHPIPAGLVEADFWVVDDRDVLLMHYSEAGEFLSAEVADDPADYLDTMDRAWAAGEPFDQWWARYPELANRATA